MYNKVNQRYIKYIDKVIKSCETKEQLKTALDWLGNIKSGNYLQYYLYLDKECVFRDTYNKLNKT